MSLTLEGSNVEPVLARRASMLRLAVFLGSIAMVALALWLIDRALAPALPPPPQRSPFGVGVREAAPAYGGMFGQLMVWQSQFFRELTQAAKTALSDGRAAWALISGSFLYGLVHAAGPGHGKAVISAYIVADNHALKRGIGLSIAAALVQAFSAIMLVGIAALVLKATARQVDSATRAIEMAAFGAIALAGIVVLWRKAGQLARLGQGGHAEVCAPDCGHTHLPGPAELSRARSFSEMAMVALAAGIRPCTGAIVVLTFCAAQGLFMVGVASVFAMAGGVALATSALAALAVLFKGVALKLAGGRGLSGERVLIGLECLAAAFVAALGLMLMLGVVAAPTG
ncbi:MAG: nickel/cobalt transporter [Bosea sp. (in: a-proteobacteria)]